MAVTARELVFKIVGDSKAFNQAVEQSTRQLDDFKKKTHDANELFSQTAKKATLVAGALGAVGVAAAKMARDFQKGFAAVQTLIPQQTARIKELQKEVLALSPAVGKTTKDLTEGLYEVISAFGDSKESSEQLALAAKGATAGIATTKDAIALLSAVTKGYGDTSVHAQQKVSDLAFTTLKLGQTSFPELAASIQRVTSQSSTLKISQEELFAVFSSGTGVIGGAAEVSTKFSALLTELQKPGERLAKTFAALNVASGTDLIARFGGLAGALTALKTEAQKTGEPISNLFGSAEAGKLALYAAGEGAEKFTKDLASMQQAAGATNQAFKDATVEGPNAFGFQLHQAALHAQSFVIKLGNELIPSLHGLLQPLFDGAAALNTLDNETLSLIVSGGKVVLTATAVAAGVLSTTKALIAAKSAVIAFTGALAANPIGLFVTGVATASVLLFEIEKGLNRIESKSVRFAQEEAQKARELVDEYTRLQNTAHKTAEEKERLITVCQKLKTLYPELTGEYDSATKAIRFETAALQELVQTKGDMIELTRLNEALDKKRKKYLHGDENLTLEYKKLAAEVKSGETFIAQLQEKIRTSTNEAEKKQLKERIDAVQQSLELPNKRIADIKTKIAGFEKDYLEAVDAVTKKQEEMANRNQAALPETAGKAAPTGGTKAPAEENTQQKRLKALDTLFQVECALLDRQTLTKEKKQAEREKLEAAHYQRRLELLTAFHKENTTQQLKENGSASLTLEQSLAKAVGNAHETIKEETEKTTAELSRIADEKHQKELTAIAAVTEKTKKAVVDEIALKTELKQIEGKTEPEKERNIHLEKAKRYLEKQNELAKEYIRLKDSENPKEKEKAQAIKQQITELEALEEAEKKAATTFAEQFAAAARKVAEKIAQIGGAINTVFSAVSDAAKAALDNKEIQRKHETARTLTAIEKKKNEQLLAFDDELALIREQKQQEDAQREHAQREQAYEKRQAAFDRDIHELEGKLETETNIEKAKELERQLEAKKKQQQEEEARKKAEDEKRKRDKQARQYEITLLNAKSQAEHEAAVARIQTENASGDAAAKAAQQAAKWQKAQGILSMSIKAAEQTALAAVDAATPFMQWNVPMRLAAAAAAIVQAGIIAGQPAPPDYIQQPLPPAPRPIKFAQGGIVLPSRGGTPITLQDGYPGIVGEAGSAELILPINAPNLHKVFQAAGINKTDNSNHISYAPSYAIEISQNADTDIEQTVLQALRNNDREVLHIIKGGEKHWCVGV